jgi:hypothetical protein
MASFVGTTEEFKRYIGPMLRNLVQQLTKKHKLEVGKCQHCSSSEMLEAAHVHGKDRGTIIDKILNNYTSNEIVTIDLANFEQHFRNEHKIIDVTIIILCRSCHSKYDSVQPVQDNVEFKKKEIENTSFHVENSNLSRKKRLFSNQEIQSRISKVAQKLSTNELKNYCEHNKSKELLDINFPLFKRIDTSASEALKRDAVKDAQGINRWTWKYEFEKDEFKYAITTQWYQRNDKYVEQWLIQYD